MSNLPPKTDFSNATASFGYKANILLEVPKGTIETYKKTGEWQYFSNIVEFDGNDNSEDPSRCSTPVISYSNGKITFTSQTNDVNFYSSITCADIASYSSSEVELSATYNISVYATKPGFTNSETVTATLCWLDSDPTTTIVNDLTSLYSTPVLISISGNSMKVSGAENVNHIEFYNLSGSYLGAEQVINGEASFETDENLVIVKIGEKSIKVKK